MDKFTPFIINRKKHRKGFALLLTLSILSMIVALSGVLVNYIAIVNKNTLQTKALIQSDILYNDIQKALKTIASQKQELYKTLYTTPLPFVLEDGRFSVLLKCSPLANGVNINWLAYEENQSFKKHMGIINKTFAYISQTYEIQNTDKLKNMILEYMQQLSSDYNNNTNIKEILSKGEFEQIIFRYMIEESDNSVINVPWEKYFVFNHIDKNINNNIIDANYMSKELISAIFDIDMASLQEDWSEGSGDLKQLLSNYGITLNSKIYYTKFYAHSRCEVYYDYMNERFKFNFDDIDNEVKNFEFYGKQ